MGHDRSKKKPERNSTKPQAGKGDRSSIKKWAAKTSQRHNRTDAIDLDYVSTWDAICFDPEDVFMHSPDVIFDDGAFDVGESYPRGV